MRKKLFFRVFVLSLVLTESVKINAHEQGMHQYITHEAFELHKMYRMTSYVGILAGDGSSTLVFINQLKYKNNIDLKNYFKTNYLLLNGKSTTLKTKRPLKISKICNAKDKVFYYGKQFIVGELYGIGFGFLTGILFAPLIPKGTHPIAGALYVAWFMYGGYTVGNSLGVYWSGKNKYDGSYIKTLIGSIIGSIAGLYIFIECDQRGPLSSALVIGPPIGSILGFNLSRKSRGSAGKAFINYNRGGKLKWSLADINVHYNRWYEPVLNVNLFPYHYF